MTTAPVLADTERGALVAAPDRLVTSVTARVTEVDGLLARVAVLLNPYDVRSLDLDLDRGRLRVVVEGDGFDAGRVEARLHKVIGLHAIVRVSSLGSAR